MKYVFTAIVVSILAVACSAFTKAPGGGFRCVNPFPIECEKWEGDGCCPPSTACRYTSQYGAECVANSPTFGSSTTTKQSAKVSVP